MPTLPPRGKLEILTEERDHMVLKAECDVAGMRAVVDFERVGDAVFPERVVQPLRVGLESVLIADVDRDRAIASQIADILIDEIERRVRRPLGQHFRLYRTVLHRKIEIERRCLWYVGARGPRGEQS